MLRTGTLGARALLPYGTAARVFEIIVDFLIWYWKDYAGSFIVMQMRLGVAAIATAAHIAHCIVAGATADDATAAITNQTTVVLVFSLPLSIRCTTRNFVRGSSRLNLLVTVGGSSAHIRVLVMNCCLLATWNYGRLRCHLQLSSSGHL